MNELTSALYDLIRAEVNIHNVKHPGNKISILDVIKHLERKNKKQL